MHRVEPVARRSSQAVRPLRPARSLSHATGASPVRIGNQAMQRLWIQAKLTVNQPGDRFEREADRVAEAVMRMPEPLHTGRMGDSRATSVPALQRMCPECEEEQHGSPAPVQRLCSKCGTKETEEESLQAKEVSGRTPEITPTIQAQIDAMRGAGRSLPESERAFFQPRFGHDFANVRIHADARAAESARQVHALAYTAGPDIVFGAGQYAPGTSAGRRLLAHELTHVVQQRSAHATTTIQRACDPPGVGPTPADCIFNRSRTPSATRFLFNVNCDDFAPGEEVRMDAFARAIPPRATIDILGLASLEGPPAFNDSLSCHRAEKGLAVIERSAHSSVTISAVEATGGIPAAHDPEMRAVAVVVTTPSLEHHPKCGPDATDWFVRQVNAATSDPDVPLIKTAMAAADILARFRGTTASVLAEAGAATAVELQEARLFLLGPSLPPPRTGAIVGQMAAGDLSQHPLNMRQVLTDFVTMGTLLAGAALGWRSLVNHNARYDFKGHKDSMHMPHTADCPEPTCPAGEHGTITFCSGTNPENCYESDLPGNLFYALIGRYVGFSELTLQLGSQLAEITDLPRPGRPVITWDTPDDTAAISLGFSLGFALPLPLTETALCAAIGPARSRLASRTGCEDCPTHILPRIR
jgi:hypothetical protein